MMMESVLTMTSTRPTSLPQDVWTIVVTFLSDLSTTFVCSKALSQVCWTEARQRAITLLRLKAVQPNLLDKQTSFVRFARNPTNKFSVIPCVSIGLDGGIKASLIVLNSSWQPIVEEVYAWKHAQILFGQERIRSFILTTVSDHMTESILRRTDHFRPTLLRRCGLFAYETEDAGETMKRIEVQWRGLFNGRQRLFGIPLIISVPRIVDRNHVHMQVFNRVLPFLRGEFNPSSPPYRLIAYNVNVAGVANEIAFTPDYMVLDSQMHAVGEKFGIVLDFGARAQEVVRFDLFGDYSVDDTKLFTPSKSMKIISALVERDCGAKLL